MITEHELTTLMGRATADVEPMPLRLNDLVRSGSRRRHRRGVYAGGAVIGAAVVAGAVVVAPWTDHSDRTDATTAFSAGACVQQVPDRVLPSWARAGFSEPRPRMPYVLGHEGRIAAVLFAEPLTSPPRTDGPTNKILWVANPAKTGSQPGAPLVIHASATDGSASVVRTVAGGPGPSIIDLPSAGCWRLDLSWGNVKDSMMLVYAAP